MTPPDLSKFSVIISTPCDGHNLDMFYVSSMCGTTRMLRELGATVNWHTSPGCADLPLARAKLFGSFYRSDATHMLLCDSDQGWNPNDVVRLLLADKEYIGAAGPKKGYPIIFAANNASEDGNLYPTFIDGNGLIECTEVGAAFMLMSRSCAEKMVNAYDATLSWDAGKNAIGKTIIEYAIYDPMVFTTPKGKRLRWSEDFSFCKRWRAIGGRIYLIPDIRLKHTGAHTWEAAQSDNFEEQISHSKLLDEGKIKIGDVVNDPTSPLYDPTKPAYVPSESLVRGAMVSLTPVDENAIKSMTQAEKNLEAAE